MAKSIRDMCELTQKSRETIIAAITAGECPGYKLNGTWTIPDEAFELFAKGYWQPQPARREPIAPSHPLVRQVNRPEHQN